jgi:protein phosphatase-4 regulatory subunit 3
MEQKIHQAYRLQFLRDTVLARVMDENLSSILSSLIFFLNFDILTFINQDPAFLRQLLGILEDESETMERKRDVIMFVQQFCAIAKTTQMATRVGVYRYVCLSGVSPIAYRNWMDESMLTQERFAVTWDEIGL